jgi:hypothetical protein
LGLSQPVALRLTVAFADTAVIAIILAIIGEFNEPPHIYLMPVYGAPYPPRPFKQILGVIRVPVL